MTINTIATIVLITITLLLIAVGIYFYIRDRSLNKIRVDVYQLFLEAEHKPGVMESGKQKMKWVLSRARSLLPSWIQLFITDKFLEKVVEGWFQAIKDLLDDGKLNGSGEESGEK